MRFKWLCTVAVEMAQIVRGLGIGKSLGDHFQDLALARRQCGVAALGNGGGAMPCSRFNSLRAIIGDSGEPPSRNA